MRHALLALLFLVCVLGDDMVLDNKISSMHEVDAALNCGVTVR